MEEVTTGWCDWTTSSQQGDTNSPMDIPQEESTLDSMDSKSNEQNFQTAFGGEDDYMNEYALYDGYDSYNENSIGSDKDTLEDDVDENKIKFSTDLRRFSSAGNGMATCERCGAIGIKHAFYSKSKRFCSLACSRSYATAQREGRPLQVFSKEPLSLLSEVPQKQRHTHKKSKSSQNRPKPQVNTIPSSYNKQNAIKSFDWGPYMLSTSSSGAPVTSFKHCPMANNWDNIAVGMKVEVINQHTDLPQTVFWIAAVVNITGYKALMRYEGFASDSKNDFWINLCSRDVHPVGWCATIGKPLVPPKPIQHRYSDWKDFLVKRLTGARTLPNNFYSKVLDEVNNHVFKENMKLEVVDKMCVSAMKVATVDEVVGGRMRVQYVESKFEGNDDFWCHLKSSLIHPVGWCHHTSHKLHADQEYKTTAARKSTMNIFDDTDCKPDMFLPVPKVPPGAKFHVGMKLEAIDPLNLSTICVATVMKVLKHGYLMIGIDGSMAQDGSDWFCYHSGSPCIFPVGFCGINGIDLTAPRGFKGQFRWFEYLKQAQATTAPVKLFKRDIPNHGFKPGMKLEAVDLMEPRLICVGTVVRVVGRLLRIHFDGWEDAYDQWIDCESPDIYPAGWCEMVNYHLEGPKTKDSGPVPQPISTKKRKTKNQVYRGPRKKKKSRFVQRQFFDENSLGHLFSDSPLEGSIHPPHIALRPEEVAASLPPVQLETLDVKPNLDSITVKQEPKDISATESDCVEGIETLNSLSQELENHNNNNNTVRNGSTNSTELANTNIFEDVKIKSEVPPAMATSSDQAQSEPVLLPTVVNTFSLSVAASSTGSQSISPVPNTSISDMATTQHSLVTSHSAPTVAKNIPRVIAGDSSPQEDLGRTSPVERLITPQTWTPFDVCQFLRTNDCGAYHESFSKKNIDGKEFLTLTKEQIVNLTAMKVGPSLKIYELIQQLKVKVASQEGHS